MTIVTINIAKDFSKYPGGRFLDDGPYNGEKFRKVCLIPHLANPDVIKIRLELDGALGYGSSFLEEAFGGLIREENFSKSDILKRFEFVSVDNSLILEIKEYIENASLK